MNEQDIVKLRSAIVNCVGNHLQRVQWTDPLTGQSATVTKIAKDGSYVILHPGTKLVLDTPELNEFAVVTRLA